MTIVSFGFLVAVLSFFNGLFFGASRAAPIDTCTNWLTVGPASCETCSMFDHARWCPRSLECYVPTANNTAWEGGCTAPVAQDKLEADCEKLCGERCVGIQDCFSSANNSCGNCVFVGGWWSPVENACYLGDEQDDAIMNRCGARGEEQRCQRTMSGCDPCDRLHKPIYCSKLLGVVIGTGLCALAFLTLLALICWRSRNRYDQASDRTMTPPGSSPYASVNVASDTNGDGLGRREGQTPPGRTSLAAPATSGHRQQRSRTDAATARDDRSSISSAPTSARGRRSANNSFCTDPRVASRNVSSKQL